MKDLGLFLGMTKTGDTKVDQDNELNFRVFDTALELGYGSVKSPNLARTLAERLRVSESMVRESIDRIEEQGDIPTILKYIPEDEEADRFVSRLFSSRVKKSMID